MLKKILIYFRAHTERRQLLRLALILSPLMAIFRVAPILIFNELDIKGRLPDFINQNVGIWLAILFVATSIFIQWIINIWLLTKPEKGEQSNRLLYKRYAWSYLLSISLLLFPNILIQVLDLPIVNNPPFSIFPFIGMVANNTAILLIVNLIITRNKKSQLELKNMQLEMNNLMAQQEQLKHQLHPHFLFNALYTLQLLIKKQPQQAEEYLNRLSTFLRTSIQHAKENKLSIKEELDFCLDYLALQKVRFGEALQYEINLPKSVSAHAALPIFTLQSLAENAIKHNALSKTKPLYLSINYSEDGWICVQNNIIPKRHQEDSTGFGLENLKERFRLLQKTEPRIKISEDKQCFLVYLPTLSL